jgi:hypothetical protein
VEHGDEKQDGADELEGHPQPGQGVKGETPPVEATEPAAVETE